MPKIKDPWEGWEVISKSEREARIPKPLPNSWRKGDRYEKHYLSLGNKREFITLDLYNSKDKAKVNVAWALTQTPIQMEHYLKLGGLKLNETIESFYNKVYKVTDKEPFLDRFSEAHIRGRDPVCYWKNGLRFCKKP